MRSRLFPDAAHGPLVGQFCCLSTSTFADSQLSWQQLSAYCQSVDLQEQARCQGYIMGAADAGALCIPASIKPSTLQDLAISTTVSDASQPPAEALQRRLKDIFPCPYATEALQVEAQPEEDAASPQRSENWSNKKRIGK